ncbi:MAG: KEOPS complex subunit Cgi121 [Nitrososphaerales archaeon]
MADSFVVVVVVVGVCLSNIETLKLGKEHAMLVGIRKLRVRDSDSFLKEIRALKRGVAVQVLDANFVAGKEHILEVLKQSLHARRTGTMLSRRIEIDLLMRVACTNQISRALENVGIKEGLNDLLIVAIGKTKDLRMLARNLEKNYKPSMGVLNLSARKKRLIVSHHRIGREEIGACIGGEGLATILAERANLLW